MNQCWSDASSENDKERHTALECNGNDTCFAVFLALTYSFAQRAIRNARQADLCPSIDLNPERIATGGDRFIWIFLAHDFPDRELFFLRKAPMSTVQLQPNDLVLLGHGSYPGGAKNFTLPANIDLQILQPVGYTLTTDVPENLLGAKSISKLVLHHDNGTSDWVPADLLHGGSGAPDLTLYPLGTLAGWGDTVTRGHTNVLQVTSPTLLSALLAQTTVTNRVKALPGGQHLRIIWMACTNQISDGPYASMS